MVRIDVLNNITEDVLSSSSSQDVQIDGYRVRTVGIDDVPIIGAVSSSSFVHVLIDSAASGDQSVVAERTLSDEQMEAEHTMTEFDGSPLKVDLLHQSKMQPENRSLLATMGWKGVDAFPCNPLGVQEARRLIAERAASISSSLASTGERMQLWVPCDGRDAMCSVLLGIRQTESGLATSVATAKGRGGSEWLAARCDSPKRFAHCQETTMARCQIELIPLIETNENEDMDEGSGRISGLLSVSASWKCSADEQVLKKPAAHATLTVTVRPGWLDSRTPHFDRCLELHSLLNFANALRTGQMVWAGTGVVDDSGTTVEEAVLHLVKQSQSALFVSDRQASAGDATTFGRRELDFTERLWLLIKECTDNNHLIKCLNIVMTALKGRELQPMVHGDNGSSLARLVRDACADQLRVPRLEGLTPIQMTLEIGLEKFRRDYTDAFGASGFLANCAQLQPLFRTDESAEDQAEALRPLHASFEVVTICQNFLKLPVHKLTAIAREVLHRFCYKRDQTYEELSFELQVGATDIPSAILEITSPVTWSMESTFKQANTIVARSSVHFGRQPLSHYASYKLESTDDNHLSKSSSEFYYCTQFTESFVYLR